MEIQRDTAAFIDAQRIARLATIDERGRPHVVPVCFARDGSTVYIAIDEKPKQGDPSRLRRLRNIAANPHVQLLLDVYDDTDWSRLRFVQLRGTASDLRPGEQHAQALALLRARYPQYRTMALEDRPVIAIGIERVVEWQPNGT